MRLWSRMRMKKWSPTLFQTKVVSIQLLSLFKIPKWVSVSPDLSSIILSATRLLYLKKFMRTEALSLRARMMNGLKRLKSLSLISNHKNNLRNKLCNLFMTDSIKTPKTLNWKKNLRNSWICSSYNHKWQRWEFPSLTKDRYWVRVKKLRMGNVVMLLSTVNSTEDWPNNQW